MALETCLIGIPNSHGARIAPSHGTRPVRLFAPLAAGGFAASQAGTSPVGSQRVSAINARNPGIANTLTLFHGRRLTLQSAMGVGTLVDGGAGVDTITRTDGSFITDGWQVDDIVCVRGATTRANDFMAVLTAVTATTLTFVTGTVAGANEVLPAGAELYRLTPMKTCAIAQNAGAAAGTAALDFLSADMPIIDASPERQFTVGPDRCLFAAVGTAMAASIYLDLVTTLGEQ